MHHTKDKGDLEVLKAQVDLFEQGFIVALPVTEHAPFDLILFIKMAYVKLYKSSTGELTEVDLWKYTLKQVGLIKMERMRSLLIKKP